MPLGLSKDGKVAAEANKFAEELAKKHQEREAKTQREFLLQVKKHPMPVLIGNRHSIVSFNPEEGFILTTEQENLKLRDDAAFWKMIEANKDLIETK